MHHVHEYDILVPYLIIYTDSDVFLVLNPKEKMGYFKKHWSADLHDDVLKCVEVEVCSCPLSSSLELITVSSKSGGYN